MFTEDLDAYLADFGEAFTLQGGAAGGVTAIFDSAYLEQAGIGGTSPVALAKAAAVAAGDINKTLTRDATGTVYTIRGREPQDDGVFVLLQLEGQMADHRAEQVMAAVMTKLTVPPLATVPAAQVVRGRGDAVPESLTPALRVYMGADAIVEPWAQQLLDSDLEVFVEAHVHTVATNVETLLNQVRKEVNIALVADYTLGLAFVHAIVERGAGRPALSGDLAKPAASMEMSYLIKYRRSRLDPSA